MKMPLHVIVAGAGIGGLMAAIALARTGARVTVLERAPEIGEVGAGLQISPNGAQILREYGLFDAVTRVALAPESLRVRRGRDGATLMTFPLGPLAEIRWGAPSLVIHRADLQSTLLAAARALPNVEIRTGVEALGFAASVAGVQVGARSSQNDARDNIRVDGDLLVGADGLRSVVRERLGLGQSDRPIWSGRTAWRALLDSRLAKPDALQLMTNLWLGPNAHIVHYPLREGAVVNIVAIVDDPWRGAADGDFWRQAGEPRELQGHFAHWCAEARDLIGSVPEWRRWPLFDRNPVTRWSVERVVLLGDAAHPVLPFLAQGAVMAIEDAAALGRAIEQNATVEAAIKAYEKSRIMRAAEVRHASRRQGVIYHLNGLPAMARDMVMKRLTRDQHMARMDWIYKYRAA